MAPSAPPSSLPSTKAAANSYEDAGPYDWSGFYLGGHMGNTWGKSNWDRQHIGGSDGCFGLLRPDAVHQSL